MISAIDHNIERELLARLARALDRDEADRSMRQQRAAEVEAARAALRSFYRERGLHP